MRAPLLFFSLASMLLAFAASAAPLPAPNLLVAPLVAGPSRSLGSFSGSAHVVMFWRSDCAPCLIELSNFRAFERVTDNHVLLIAAEPAADARRTLERLGVPLTQAYAATGAPEALLAAVSNGGRRLPYAIALTPQGQMCDRHVGLLGTDQAHAWMQQCSR
jgi:hypothetical protein